MVSQNQEVALYCLFHNASSYETADNRPCSHIYSGIVRRDEKGLALSVFDYDGQSRKIETDTDAQKFDLATIIPVKENRVLKLSQWVDQINRLGEADKWPFYFSRDMSVRPERETRNQYAIAPEGHIDPPVHHQKVEKHQSSGERLLARINCVRMSLLTARFAGIHVDNIAGINPQSNTGEEIRDQIKSAYHRLLGHRDLVLRDKFSKKAKAGDDKDPDFVLSGDGLCVIQSGRKEFRLQNIEDALERRIRGKSLFDWIAGGQPEKFAAQPIQPPAYLKAALDFSR